MKKWSSMPRTVTELGITPFSQTLRNLWLFHISAMGYISGKMTVIAKWNQVTLSRTRRSTASFNVAVDCWEVREQIKRAMVTTQTPQEAYVCQRTRYGSRYGGGCGCGYGYSYRYLDSVTDIGIANAKYVIQQANLQSSGPVVSTQPCSGP